MNKKVDEEYEGIKDVYILQCICSELKQQLQQKENIIKKVREYIKETHYYSEVINEEYLLKSELERILDKEVN